MHSKYVLCSHKLGQKKNVFFLQLIIKIIDNKLSFFAYIMFQTFEICIQADNRLNECTREEVSIKMLRILFTYKSTAHYHWPRPLLKRRPSHGSQGKIVYWLLKLLYPRFIFVLQPKKRKKKELSISVCIKILFFFIDTLISRER